MKSRYWFLLSAILFVAAGYFWHLGEKQRAARQASPSAVSNEKQDSQSSQTKSSLDKTVSGPKNASANKQLNDSTNNVSTNSTNSALAKATNEALLFPHRLKNTKQSLKQLVRNDRAILLRNAWIDTGAESVKIPDELRSKGDPGSYIVQSRGPVDATFRAALLEANAEIISYVPNNAYLVRLPNGSAKLAQNKQVSSVLPYEPYYKLDTDLLGMAIDKKELPRGKMLRVGLFPGQRDAAIKALKGHAQIVGEDLKSSPFGPELIVASADLVQLANLPQVQEIEPYYERQMMNDLTRVTLGVSSNSTATANYLDLTGSNVWVNVNDTPIDNSHPDLAGRVFPGAGVAVVDTDGHGTHVAGIIASSGANGPTSDSITNFGSVVGANFRGEAPAASILSFDIFAGLSDAEIQQAAAETNYVELNRQSPLISNNSWGYGTATYNSSAASFDAAVRDALPGGIGSQPIAYVFSAGNSGDAPVTVNSPATAKNVISVGALESNRGITNEVVDCHSETNQPFLDMTDSSDEVADFSSRGNVGILLEGPFGRLKPDVVAPGTFIISTRSQQFDEASYYSPLRSATQFFPGLVIDPFATNNFSTFIPDEACGEGSTMSLTIEAIPVAPVSPDIALLIYTGTAPNPSSGGTFQGANSVTIDRANLPLANVLNYDIVNTNDFEITYNLRTTLVLSNDYGTYFQVLSNLNAQIGPYYRFESGTSMSAPAISGMLALMQEFFEQRFQITNSPAMMKALLINGSRAVGTGYNREAALNNSGWGLPDIRRIIPEGADRAAWPVQLFDQSTNFTLATGEQHDRVLTMSDTNSPLRITLVWTDPPGNPAVGTKLVNDLDLVVSAVVTNGVDTNNQPVVRTNYYFGNNFSGGEFTQASVLGTNGVSEFDAVRDAVNNVENVYINAPVSGQYTVSVIGRRVNVNAVTAHTNGIVQDYALVIAADNGTNAPFTVTTNLVAANTNSLVTVVSNGIPLLKQRVGANSPLQNVNANNLTEGTNTQWAFYVLNNPSNFTNVAFLTFLPPNLSGATNTVPGSRRVVDADIDMYVSTDPTLTNLNPTAIAAADKSLKRGGQELIVYTNRSDAVFYVGIKSEDQRASEFSFFAVASDTPFSNEENGNISIPHGFPAAGADIPDGSPESPGGAVYIMIAATGGDAKVGRVVVTNQITHERIGDLITTLSHQSTTGEDSVSLLNHSFPDGQETGTFTGIYDDSGLDEGDAVSGSRATDGPGSLLDFVGTEAVGAWIITAEDNSVNSTGRVNFASMFIERALETNDLFGADGFTISGDIGPNQSRGVSFIVPPNTTNMIISISPKEGPLDTVVRRGRLAPTRNPYVDKGVVISPPGGSLTVGTNDIPPLKPGRYVLRLYNDNGTPVNFTGRVEFQLDLTARSIQTYTSSGPALILDDATTNSVIHVDRDGRVVSTEVSVRIDHSRISDLVLHLVSPQGTRILLAENRGGLSTNGYGFSNLQTNVFPTTTFGGGTSGQTNSFGPILNSGFIRINYEFYDQDPDEMQVFYDGRLIYDTGIVLGSNSILIPYGPGTSTDVVVVMNPNGNPSSGTAWEYTVTVLSGDFVYATFSENTNLARVPIKFAIPPFATNIAGLNTNTLMSSYFESDPAGTYSTTVDGWTVSTNAVDVVSDATQAHRGTNYLSLGNGAISRTLPTVAGEFYNLKFGYRRDRPDNLATANIAIEGILTNEFVGSPSWIVHSSAFVAPKNGTKLDIEGLGTQGGGSSNLIANGSFEAGLTGWTHDANTQLSPGYVPASDGSNCVHLGIYDVAGSVLSQSFPVLGGNSYVLSFDLLALGSPSYFCITRVDLLTSQGVVASQTYTNTCRDTAPFVYQTKSIAFDVPLGNTNATVRFVDLSPNGGRARDPVMDNVKITGAGSGMWFDTFELVKGGDPNYFLPEESLKTLVGENAKGDWKLEIWDNRAGAPLTGGELVGWQLNLTFASTNTTATSLTNATQSTNTVAGSDMKYFIVDVPIFATHATNVLVSGGGALNLWFNEDELPLGNPALGDTMILSSTMNGTAVLTTTSFPDLRPGRRYYLGVQNANPAQTNFFTLTVTFDDTNNLVNVTPLTNATPYSATLPFGQNIQYYQYDLLGPVSGIQFKLFNLNADADLVVRRDQLPTENIFDWNSNLGGTNDEIINVSAPVPGRYYLGVYGFAPTNSITYNILVTEGTAAPAPTFSSQFTISPSGFHMTADTIVGRTYEFEVSEDLVTWTLLSTTTATANVTTFTDPTPPSTKAARFYRLRLLP